MFGDIVGVIIEYKFIMDPTTTNTNPLAAGTNPVAPSTTPAPTDPMATSPVAAPVEPAAVPTTPVTPPPQLTPLPSTPVAAPAMPAAPVASPTAAVPPTAPVAGPNDLNPDELSKMVEGLSPEQVAQLQQQVQKLASGDLSKYKMRFKGTTFDQLMQLVKSSTLLEPEDHPKFEAKYKDMQNVAELEKAFNVLFEEEHEYLTEEIAEMDKLLAGKLQGDQNTINLQTAYKARLVALQTLEQTLTGTQPLPPVV